MVETLQLFEDIARSYYDIKDSEKFNSETKEYRDEIAKWGQKFYADIYNSRRGYPIGKVFKEPELEYQLHNIVSNLHSPYLPHSDQPTLVLSHDIDYIKMTTPLFLKTLIGRRKYLNPFPKENFVHSIEKYLSFEKSTLPQDVKSILFIPAVIPAKKYKQRLIQKIIDPTYSLDDPVFKELRKVIDIYGADVGIHGSYFSTNLSFAKEKELLEKKLERTILASRQHWLHVPHTRSLEIIAESGVKYDSTLGWNGHIGFRCGLSRPYRLNFGTNSLISIPLLIMDGVLFDELKYNEDTAFEKCKHYLDIVFRNKGTVAINWHGRTYDSPYDWGSLYKKLILWSLDRGFKIESFSKVAGRFDDRTKK